MKHTHFKQVRFHGDFHFWKCLYSNTIAQCKAKLLLYWDFQAATLSCVKMQFAPAMQGTWKAADFSVFCTGILEVSITTVLHNWSGFLPHRLGDFMCQDDLAELIGDLEIHRVLADVPHESWSKLLWNKWTFNQWLTTVIKSGRIPQCVLQSDSCLDL